MFVILTVGVSMADTTKDSKLYHAFYKDLDAVEEPGQGIVRQIEELLLAFELSGVQTAKSRRAMTRLIAIRKRVLERNYKTSS
jgi:hypothetical protein